MWSDFIIPWPPEVLAEIYRRAEEDRQHREAMRRLWLVEKQRDLEPVEETKQ